MNRSFNRTSFQQQLKQLYLILINFLIRLQSYILSTTTETSLRSDSVSYEIASIVHPFNNN